MEIGDKVVYNFPNPLNSNNDKFIGILEIISDTHIYIRNEEGIRLKVSFKNFDLLELYKENQLFDIKSENYFG
ncbi:MAG: hypothetical protein KJ571_19165 [Bacteroidetes bacterium]|nr:hypothetical protein [Bacteroidota bacterium]